jgi:hypothetical protein
MDCFKFLVAYISICNVLKLSAIYVNDNLLKTLKNVLNLKTVSYNHLHDLFIFIPGNGQ